MELWKIQHNIRCYEIATLMMKYEFDTKRIDEILSRVYKEPIENQRESGIIEERNDVETKVKCVWGSPLSGKSTYVEQHAGKNDIVWDWDKVKQAVGLVKPHEKSRRILSDLLLKLRYTFLKSIDGSGAGTAWFICTRPNEYIKNLLGEKAEYIKMDVSKEECLKRLENDNSRSDKQKMAELINDFFDEKRYNDGSHYTKDEHGKFTGSTSSGGGSSGGSGGSFYKEGDDPMFEAFGKAEDSNPEELKQILSDLENMGVKVNVTENTLAYNSLRIGEPGEMSVTKNASYSAYLHEYQHVIDDKAAGWNGSRIVWDVGEHIRRERIAYQVEIDLAVRLGRFDIAKKLEYNRDEEIFNIKKRDEFYVAEHDKNK